MTERKTATAGFVSGLAQAEAALAGFARGPAQAAADSLADSFARAGARIERDLGKAAEEGEVSMKRLARVIAEETARAALDRWLPEARVSRGGSNAPNTAGFAGAPVTIHVHVGGGGEVDAFRRSEGQIAAAVARAVAIGRRGL